MKRTKTEKRSRLADLLGILAAIAIAFGGLALVEVRLAAEEDRILDAGGEMRIIQVQTQKMEAQDVDEAAVRQAELTQEELAQAVECLKRGGDRHLHEPQAGQLSMAQAVDCGKGWMEEFLLPRLGLEPDEGGEAREYKVGCFLWAREEESGEAPWLSYWAVELNAAGIDGMLILNAATGQVMSAAVTVSHPIEYQDRDRIDTLLDDYADSFGIVSSYSTVGRYDLGTKSFRKSLGNGEMSAVIDISSVVMTSADNAAGDMDTPDSRAIYEYEYVYIYLQLTMTADIAGSEEAR
nr:hypothetical protein [uncultured Acetatifactor sp.]